MTAGKSLAQWALETYDREGEAGLLDFLIINRDSNPRSREQTRKHWQDGLHILQDLSSVRIKPHENVYSFYWPGGHAIRPASELALAMPLPPEPDVPMLPWPGVESIVWAMIHRVERQVREELGLEAPSAPGGDPILNRYQSLILAPDIYERAREFVQNVYDMPDSILSILDEEQEHCAEMALESLPEEQMAALYNAAAKAVQDAVERPPE